MEKNISNKLILDQFEEDWKVCKGQPANNDEKAEYKLVSDVELYDDDDYSFENVDEFQDSWNS